jgi:hypothetical protein
MEISLKYFGYFDSETIKPTFDPGVNVNCPICNKRLQRPIQTISFLCKAKSYFYRIHKKCANLESEQKIESMIVDLLNSESN